MRQIALLVFAAGITGLFLLERDKKHRPTRALFLPLAWLLIAGSRNVGEWLSMGAPSDGGDAYLDGNPLDRNLLSLMIAMAVYILYQRRSKVGAMLRANWPLLLYFGYCAVSLAWSDFPFVGFKRWIRALGDVAMVLIVLSESDWLLARKKLYAWAAFLLLPISVLLIRYYSELGRNYSVYDGQVFWTGVTTNKNELGMICMIFGLGSVSRVLDVLRRSESRRQQKKLLLAHGTIVATAIWLLHMADSATSLACFALGSCVLVLTSWKPIMKRPALVHVMVWSMIGIAASALFLGVGSGMVEDLGRNSTLTGRTQMWQHALALVESPMFGAGYESFWVGDRLEKMRPVAPGVNQAHNGYLEVYLNLGWIGVFFLILVIATGYRNVIKAFRRDPDVNRARLAYFVVALSYAFTESAFKFRHPVWISFLLAIVAVPAFRLRNKKDMKVAPALVEEPEVAAEVPVYEERF